MLSAIRCANGNISKAIADEIRAALSQIAAFCKSDGNLGGLSGVALQKRKVILKELWDMVVKSNSILGGGVQL